MPKVIESVRFGELELADEALVEFPLGLIGLPGSGYALLDVSPESGIRWLHSTEDPALALPVLDPRAALLGFQLAVGVEERQRIGTEDLEKTQVYVTVRASPDPAQTTVNLRAPLIVWQGRGHQVINTAPGAELRAPLLAPATGEN
jgi:flagellar assembly factor FliW